jgi:hypothetical protein
MAQLEYIRTLCSAGGHAALYQAVPPIHGHVHVIILASDVVVDGLPLTRTTMYAASPQGELVHGVYLYRTSGYDHTGLAEEIGYDIRSRNAFPESKATTNRSLSLDRNLPGRRPSRPAL